MTRTVYLRMKRNVSVSENKQLLLNDIAHIAAPIEIKEIFENKPIYRIRDADLNILVIDVFLIIKELTKEFPKWEIETVGPEQTVIRIEKKRRKANLFIACLIWLLLFVGTAMTIMNFHYDVSMQEVQQRLHFILTGEENEFPLWIQIPYSLGLGLGTLLFFNHWFNKRFNEEPSPLEIEISNYQTELDQYLVIHENELDDRS
ncbi:stage V sporulation protein AA [Oceanobacillus alkalisoli]|uniref:stage V sporulation protein AA n=1 Tax=Oceanobacillus alkalisoli TaxID=2925113 RepID=UPI001EEFBA17|nr:stage V sporulation protein AA [Oceanobacillus alkalisoli]MCF3941692.1 stage V sporulation protein AA [Oceanobacillus alkalisoli]MCG5102973.1 stage V sporulation protein AA [Oceanobacillus alkalisoli]